MRSQNVPYDIVFCLVFFFYDFTKYYDLMMRKPLFAYNNYLTFNIFIVLSHISHYHNATVIFLTGERRLQVDLLEQTSDQ